MLKVSGHRYGQWADFLKKIIKSPWEWINDPFVEDKFKLWGTYSGKMQHMRILFLWFVL